MVYLSPVPNYSWDAVAILHWLSSPPEASSCKALEVPLSQLLTLGYMILLVEPLHRSSRSKRVDAPTPPLSNLPLKAPLDRLSADALACIHS